MDRNCSNKGFRLQASAKNLEPFDLLPQRLGYLVLARAGAVGEELSFLVLAPGSPPP
jgi:hypothetical protein